MQTKILNSALISSIIVVLVIFSSCTKKESTSKKHLFKKLDSLETGINFINSLVPDGQLNIINFNGFYNGGGVATGDINNDGLKDVFFTSNKGKNKLFLNKGNLKFEDITDKANVQGNAEWSTGVTMVDINADGFLDIYVSVVSKFKGLRGVNELYINNGDLTFTESARQYGLNFTSYSNQAVFFDYDHDGDLDCFIVNMAHENALFLRKSEVRYNFDANTGDILLRNDGGYFKEVSKEANIYRSEIGFGLAVTVADFNDDGWEDIYVSNDFFENDYLYINQKDGTFKDKGAEYIGHMSRFSMGADAADINNDGFIDLMTLDMAPENERILKKSLGEEAFDVFHYKKENYGFHTQYATNCLQLNNNGKSFSEIASFANVEATDWSWGPLIQDLDNDGIKDIYISNGIVRRANDLDLINYVDNYLEKPKSANDLPKYFSDYYAKMPTGEAHDYIYKGTDSLVFEDKSLDWGLAKANISNGASLTDLDNDGDLEIIINQINKPAIIYKNLAREKFNTNYINVKLKGDKLNVNGIGAKVYVKTGEATQMHQMVITRGFLSSMSPEVHFGIGEHSSIDSLWVKWNDGKISSIKNPTINTSITVLQKEAKSKMQNETALFERQVIATKRDMIHFEHKENKFIDFSQDALAPFMASTEGPALAIGDIDGDGLEDVFVGGAKGQTSEIWLQKKNEVFLKQQTSIFTNDDIYEDVVATLFDIDNDGDLDLYVGTGGNEAVNEKLKDRIYINDGKGRYTKGNQLLPEFLINTSCVSVSDFDKDGDIDIFVGGRSISGTYGIIPDSFLLVNDGKGLFTKSETFNEGDSKIGMVTDAKWNDIDNDGDYDLIVVGEWMPITVFKNRKGRFVKSEINTSQSTKGLWHSVEIADIDNDGDKDIIGGNLGLNNRFKTKNGNGAIRMYVKDFDANGKPEQILCYNRNDVWYPINNRDELGKVLPSIIKKRFKTNNDYAGKSVKEVFTPIELEGAMLLEADVLASLYLSNDGKGSFQVENLPLLAQFAPIYDLEVIDVNLDGHMDVIGGGNLTGVSPFQGVYDASKGFCLFGGKDGLKTYESLDIIGEIRQIKKLYVNDKNWLLIAKNNDTITSLKLSN